MQPSLPLALSIAAVLSAGLPANAATLGSAANPAFSANQILQNGASLGDGIYWIDPDGAGGDAAFQVIADMTTAGGGWTLGLQSLASDPNPQTDMIANTGTVSATTSYTANMIALAIDQTAQIRHRILNGSTVLFDGYYSGTYHGTFGGAGDWTVLAGDAAATGTDYHYGMEWTTLSDDNDTYGPANCAALYDGLPWYYRSCFYSIPYYSSATGPYSATNVVSSYQIFVRESETPALQEAPVVPLPASFGLLLFAVSGLAGAAAFGRRHRT